jgi:ribosome-associated protein
VLAAKPPAVVPRKLPADFVLPEQELEERFVRSSGPGGQNVNKVATAVELRFNLRTSSVLPDDVRQRLLATRDQRLTKDGEIVIQASEFRSLERNRQAAKARLLDWLAVGFFVPKTRRKSKPSKAAVQKRLNDKSQQAAKKSSRTQRHHND